MQKSLLIGLSIITVLLAGTFTISFDLFQSAEAAKAKGTLLLKYGSETKKLVCGDRLCSEGPQTPKVKVGFDADVEVEVKPVSPDILQYTKTPPEIDPEKGYFVTEIADGLYWLIDGSYQVMFLTTGEGVIAIDAPEGLGEKYLDAIADVTDEPVTHFIYSHIHKDHTGAAHIFPDDTVYISHKDAAKHLEMKNDPDRPVPTATFEDSLTIRVGTQELELSYIGPFHSIGDTVIFAPKQKVAMQVDMFHPGGAPFYGFALTPNVNAYLEAHEILVNDYDFDVLISGHEQILATKDHIKQNKQFTLDVRENVMQAMQTVDFGAIAQEYGTQGGYAVFSAYVNAIGDFCADLTNDQWKDKIHSLGPFTKSYCTTMQFYLQID